MQRRVRKKKQSVPIDNKGLIIIGLFVGGILLGTLLANTLDPVTVAELVQYVRKTLEQVKGVTVYHGEYLFDSYTSQIKIILLIWIAGFFAYGFSIIYATVLVKGFLYGFSIAFFTAQFKLAGFFFGFLSYLPQNLIYLPVTYILAKVCIGRSYQATGGGKKGMHMNKNDLFEYTIVLVVSLAFFGLGALIETYISPRIVANFIGKF